MNVSAQMADKVTALPKPAIGEADIFANLSERLTQKRQAVEVAKDALETAINAEGDAAIAADVVSQWQGRAIDVIAKGMIAGLLTKDEASSLYGDAYGYKAKADGTPGKTPDGAGNTLRKRSVLLAEAYAITEGTIKEDSLPRWAQGKSISHEIAPIVTQWLEGNESPWSAYKALTEREKPEPVELPYDEKKLLKILEAISSEESLARIMNNPALIAAYDAIAAKWTQRAEGSQF